MYTFVTPDALAAEVADRYWPGLRSRTVPLTRLLPAGTYQSTLARTPDAAAATLPGGDGLHIAWLAGTWADVLACVVAGGTPHPIALRDAVADDAAEACSDESGPPWIAVQP